MINKSTINKLNEAITEADIIATQTDIQEKGVYIRKVIFDPAYNIIYSHICIYNIYFTYDTSYITLCEHDMLRFVKDFIIF